MAFVKCVVLPIMLYLIANVQAKLPANLLDKKPIKVKAKYEELIYQSMKSIVSLDELVTTLSVQVAVLTTSLSQMKVDVKKIGEQNVDLSTAMKELNDRITKESAKVTATMRKTQTDLTDLQSSFKKTKKDLGNVETEIKNLKASDTEINVKVNKVNKQVAVGVAELRSLSKVTKMDIRNIRTEIKNLKASNFKINAKVDKMLKKEVAVVTGEEKGGNQKCAKVCAGTTGRKTSSWKNYPSQGIYMNVDIRRCGFVKVPTITTSLEGSSSHWTALGTSSVYSAQANRFSIFVYQRGLRTSSAKKFKWNVEWIAVGYTC